jgi:predicted MFS family arabinose efflux permease
MWEVGEPARKAHIVDLAPANLWGRAFGLYYLLRNLAVVPAALLGGLLWQWAGPQSVFYAAFASGAIGLIYYALQARDGMPVGSRREPDARV